MDRKILDKIADKLQKAASEKYEKEIENGKSYWQWYVEGCEDFHRELRRLLGKRRSRNDNRIIS